MGLVLHLGPKSFTSVHRRPSWSLGQFLTAFHDKPSSLHHNYMLPRSGLECRALFVAQNLGLLRIEVHLINLHQVETN